MLYGLFFRFSAMHNISKQLFTKYELCIIYLFCQDLYILLGKHSNIWSCNGTVYTNKGIWIFKIGFHSFFFFFFFFFFGAKCKLNPDVHHQYSISSSFQRELGSSRSGNHFFLLIFLKERERERERCNLDVKHLNPL